MSYLAGAFFLATRQPGCAAHYHQEAEWEKELLVCASLGDLDRIRQLVEIHRVNVNCVDKKHSGDGKTPLILAVGDGNLEVARFLLVNDANVDAVDMYGRTALARVVILNNDRVAVAELLLEFGANVDTRIVSSFEYSLLSSFEYSLLGIAIFKCNVEMVRLLLRFGANTRETIYEGKTYTALYLACWKSNVEVVQLVLDHTDGVDINTSVPREDDVGPAMSPLCQACKRSELEMVKLLVQHGARVFYDDGIYPDFSSPLVQAVRHRSLEIVRFLLDQTNLREGQRGDNNHPFSPALEMALRGNRLQIAQLLLDHGANVNDRAFSFLHRFAQDGQYKYARTVYFLLQAGANVNLAGRESGETPLYVAAKNGYVGLVKELLRKHADVCIRDKNGDTPLGVAYSQGHKDIVYLLLRTSPHVWSKLAEVWTIASPETSQCTIL